MNNLYIEQEQDKTKDYTTKIKLTPLIVLIWLLIYIKKAVVCFVYIVIDNNELPAGSLKKTTALSADTLRNRSQ